MKSSRTFVWSSTIYAFSRDAGGVSPAIVLSFWHLDIKLRLDESRGYGRNPQFRGYTVYTVQSWLVFRYVWCHSLLRNNNNITDIPNIAPCAVCPPSLTVCKHCKHCSGPGATKHRDNQLKIIKPPIFAAVIMLIFIPANHQHQFIPATKNLSRPKWVKMVGSWVDRQQRQTWHQMLRNPPPCLPSPLNPSPGRGCVSLARNDKWLDS